VVRAPARKLRPRDAAGSGGKPRARERPPVGRERAPGDGAVPAASAGDRATATAARDAAEAIGRFLDALVPSGERDGASLEGTPERVAEAWLQDLLDGYRQNPAAILAEAMPSAGEDLVAVTGIDFHSVCPHHLLPSRGLAHVAYVPGDKVVGFGQIARLVDCFAHRLVLEEDLARHVAESLVSLLGARGAACILDAEQACLTMRGERRRGARTHVQCFLGILDSDVRLQARLLALVAGGKPEPEELRSRADAAHSPAGVRRRGARRIADREGGRSASPAGRQERKR
jgi:GTP cyclohydrolase IA